MQKTPAFIVLRVLGLETTVIELVSPLRRDECVRRLRDHVDAGFEISGMRPVMGNVGDTSFLLRQRTGYRNSFATALRGTFVEESRQTQVRCRSGVHPFVRVFMLLWLGATVVAFIVGLPVVSSLIYVMPPRAAPPIATFAVPALMFCFGVALVRIGRHAAGDQQRYLIDFVTRWLEARTAPAGER